MARRRRYLITGLSIVLIVAVVLIVAYIQLHAKGDQKKTSALPTPTFETRIARTFGIAPDESQVDFTTQVNGITLEGVFPVTEGRITLVPEGTELRVLVDLTINVDGLSTGSPLVDTVMRQIMKSRGTGDTFPLSFYVGESEGLVPVTEEPIEFTLDGELQLHGVVAEHSMHVNAQLIGQDMTAVATSDLDLANHGIEISEPFESSTIQLTARLKAYEAAP
jgi:polyisoprenoid-binding protein YceI